MLFQPKRRRSKEAHVRLAKAYQAVFMGNATPEDATIVLADLAAFSGYYRVETPISILQKRTDLMYNEGRRRVFARILRYVGMPEPDMAALEKAARLESQVNQQEGEF